MKDARMRGRGGRQRFEDHVPTGQAIDRTGGPVVDPTANVISLTDAANRRQDDLRNATKELFDTKMRHVEQVAALRAHHQQDLDKAEAARLDSIRQIDREDVTKTAAAAVAAIQTLAATTNTTAETLRQQVSGTAQSIANQLSVITAEITKRVSALELALSEGKGKQTVADPQMAMLMSRMESLMEARATTSGRDAGVALSWATLAGFVGLIISLFAVGGLILDIGNNAPATPSQIIYTPAPPDTLLPSTPPATPPPR